MLVISNFKKDGGRGKDEDTESEEPVSKNAS